jgi:hypothetical protein
MLDFILQKLILYSGCTIPSIIFYLLTRNQSIKHANCGPSDWLLLVISGVEIMVPVLYDSRGTVLDQVICAVMAIIMSSGMLYYVRDRHRTPEGKPIQPFYEILTHWNEKTSSAQDDKKHDDPVPQPTLGEMRLNAYKFLSRAILYTVIYIPVFATMDGFIRACQEPPELSQPVSYLYRIFTSVTPWRSTFYFIWVGVTFSLHIALVPLVHLLLHAIQLNVCVWLPVQKDVQLKLHNDLKKFVSQPPLFDKPWLTRSVYDLWSHRWHQIFRIGFYQVAYLPVRNLFGKKNMALVGRIMGSLAVFMCSGLMHDYIILSMLGYSNWRRSGILGYQTLFFMLQGFASIISVVSPRLPTVLSRTLTWIWVLYTAPLFVEPYIRVGLHYELEVPGFPKFMDEPIQSICPYGNSTQF